MRKSLLINSLFILLLIFVNMTAIAADKVIADFESGQNFVAEESAISVVTSSEYASEGESSLKILYGNLTGSKKGYVKTVTENSWSGTTAVKMDVYNPNDVELQFAMFVQIGDDFEWNESTLVPLAPGEHKDMVFQLDEAIWKNASSGWSFSETINPAAVVEYGFMVYPVGSAPSGEIYVDNVRLVGGGAVETTDIIVKETDNTDIGPVDISGDVELTVTSEEIRIPLEDDVTSYDITASHFGPEDGGSLPNSPTGVTEDGKEAVFVEAAPENNAFRYVFSGNPVDLSVYDRIEIELKTSEDVFYQVIPRHGSGWTWGYQHELDITGGSWQTITLIPSEIASVDWTNIQAFSFQHFNATSDVYIASIVGVIEGEGYTTETELNRTHKVNVRADYSINENWDAAAQVTFSDPFATLSLVELKGKVEQTNIRTFYDGTADDSSDPFTIFKAENYHEDSTFGMVADGMAEDVALMAAVLMPLSTEKEDYFVKDEFGEPLFLVDANYSIDDLTTLSGVLVYETSEDDTVDNNYRVGLGVERGFMSGIQADGEIVIGNGDDNKALFAKATFPLEIMDLKAGMKYRDTGYWDDYADITGSSVREIYADGTFSIFDGGFYLSHYSNMGNYENYFAEFKYNYRFNDIVSMKSKTSYKIYQDPTNDEPFKIDPATMINVNFAFNPEIEGVTANLIALLRSEGDTETGDLSLNRPAIVGLATYKPVEGLELYGEYGVIRENPGGESTNNFYARITKSVGDGSLEVSYGKETLNDDQDEVQNVETPDEYLTMKYTIKF